MKGPSPRYTTPVATKRPQGARLLEAFSPKLARRITLFDRASFDLWTLLESDPDVLALCERPVALAPATSPVDFWVHRRDCEELLLLQRHEALARAVHTSELPVRKVTAADLAAQRTWIYNWQRILPVIISTRGLVSKALKDSVLRRVSEPTTIGLIEREVRVGDPVLVRAAIFDLLRSGQVQAPALHSERLSSLTALEPVA